MKKSLKTVLVAAAFSAVAISEVSAKPKDNMQGVVKMEKLRLEKNWDKTFPKSDKVSHKKVTFVNHFGITLAADMYTPTEETLRQIHGENFDAKNTKLPAIAVSGPFGAVKEQSSGLYAQSMAERGFLTIAFDPSFTGESGGNPRNVNSPDINTEDFQAAVDFLSVQPNVDSEKIGIIGICGWGGYALNVAAIDTRIKASAAITMYDLSRTANNGYFDAADNEAARYQARVAMNNQRTEDYKNGTYARNGGVAENRPEGEDVPEFLGQYWDYYKTPRGYAERSPNSNGGWAIQGLSSLMNTRILRFSNEIRSAVLVVHGEKAHSRYMGETAYNDMTKDSKYTANKELFIVPNATHCDLYDGGENNYIPWDKLQSFFESYLK